MNVYYLERKDCGLDEYEAKIIVASSEARARELANKNVGDEGRIWEDVNEVSCSIIDTENEHIVHEDFRAG